MLEDGIQITAIINCINSFTFSVKWFCKKKIVQIDTVGLKFSKIYYTKLSFFFFYLVASVYQTTFIEHQQFTGSIPWFYVTELFSSEARASASAVASATNWLSNTIVGLLFPVFQVEKINFFF